MAGSSTKRATAVDYFIRTSGLLAVGSSRLSDDTAQNVVLAAAELDTDSVLHSMGNYPERVEQELANASPEIRELAARVGIKSPLLIEAGVDSSAHIPGDLDRRLSTMKAKLTELTSQLVKVADDANNDFERLTRTAASDLKAAIKKLMLLALLIRGEWKYSPKEADKFGAVTAEIDNALGIASNSAELTLDRMRFYEGAFTQVRDAKLKHGLQHDLTMFKDEVDSWITRTTQELNELDNKLASNREMLTARQQVLNNAIARYEKAESDAHSAETAETVAWSVFWPVGLAIHYTVSPRFIEEVSMSQKLVDQAGYQHDQVQRDKNATEVRARELQNVLRLFEDVKIDFTVLESNVTQAEVAAMGYERACKTIEGETMNIWASVKAAGNAASAAGWALTKVQYAYRILEILDKARFEKSIKLSALDIIKELGSHDDSRKAVAGISAPLSPGQSFLLFLSDRYNEM